MTSREIYKQKMGIAQDEPVLCEITGKPGEVHHILYLSQGGRDHIENLIALTKHEHKVAHGEIGGRRKYTRAELTMIHKTSMIQRGIEYDRTKFNYDERGDS